MTAADTAQSLEVDPDAARRSSREPGTGTYRYTLGHGSPWFLVVGERLAVALQPPVDPALAETLWRIVRDDLATIDDVLAWAPGEREDMPIAVVARSATGADVFVNGGAVADVRDTTGWRRVATRGAHPWRREQAEDVTAIVLGDVESVAPGAPAAGVSFALGSGVVVANRIHWSADTAATAEAGAAVRAAPASATEQADHGPENPDALRTASTSVDSAAAEVAPAAAAPGGGPTAAPAPIGPPPVAPAVAVTPPLTHSPAPGLTPAETDTVIRPRREVRQQDAGAQDRPEVHDPLLRHDGDTVLRRDIDPPIEDETVLRQKPYVPDDPQTVVYGFRINGGQAYPLDAVHYFGRNPRQPRIPLPDPSRLVPVVSASKSVSATHLEVKQIGDAIVATDLKSTNGTSVILPGKHWQRLRAGETVVVVPGTFIDIGDGNVIEILPPWPGA